MSFSAGRSDGNYRLFDETALWCARVIIQMRSLGLTNKRSSGSPTHLADPDEPI